MPRVHTRTRSNRPVKRPFVCSGCGNEIQPGEQFYTWKKRYQGSSYRHISCGYPRPSQLSNAKTAIVLDAVQDAENEIGGLSAELDDDGTYSGSLVEDIQATLETVADEAEAVADEYESSADNMPESLQYGSQAEAMREVAQELRDWADNVRSFSPNEDTPDLPDAPEEGEEDERPSRLEEWAESVKSDATDLLGDMPEYQG